MKNKTLFSPIFSRLWSIQVDESTTLRCKHDLIFKIVILETKRPKRISIEKIASGKKSFKSNFGSGVIKASKH